MSITITQVYVCTEPGSIPNEAKDGLVIDYSADSRACTLDANFENIYQTCGIPPQTALDFALFASAVYIADKKVLRHKQADAWTRYYHLSVPVFELDRWQAIKEPAAQMLNFLTGDVWDLSFRPSRKWTIQTGLQLSYFGKAEAICLFSGGLDSAIGAVNLLENNKNLLLVGHYDNNHTKNDETIVFEELLNHYPDEKVDMLQVRIRPASRTELQEHNLPSVVENSTRSRSMVFLAVGLLAASAISPDTEIFMPENGFISLNIPLTPARRGSNSTRTTHPYFLDRLKHILRTIGLHNPIHNPFSILTKGEMVQNCPNQKVLEQLAKLTVSCSHPEVLRFTRRERGNCGYCYPCLIRRAALNVAEMDDYRDYGWNICDDVNLIKGSGRGKDARAVFLALNEAKRSKFTFLSLVAGGPLISSMVELEKLRHVYVQGLSEIEQLFIEQATPEVLKLAGLN